MSLGIVIKGPEGLVLAADSRVTLTANTPQGAVHVNYDNATKLLSFSDPHSYVGAVTYGQAAIGLRTANSYLPEFESSLAEGRLTVEGFAQKLSDFFVEQWQREMPSDYKGLDMTFVVGGFNQGEPYGRVLLFDVPGHPGPQLQNEGAFGMTWGGQRQIVDRLMQGFDEGLVGIVAREEKIEDEERLRSLREVLRRELQLPVPIQAMALQDCVDLAIFFLRTTVWAQKLAVGIRGVGGAIDVAIITRREGFRFIRRKVVSAEQE